MVKVMSRGKCERRGHEAGPAAGCICAGAAPFVWVCDARRAGSQTAAARGGMWDRWKGLNVHVLRHIGETTLLSLGTVGK